MPETSILKSIRQRIGPSASYDVFDEDLITNINSSFTQLCRQGIGPSTPFKITGESEEWSDFMSEEEMPEDVKQYIYLKARLVFDPPQSATVIKMYQEEADKIEWLLRDFALYGY